MNATSKADIFKVHIRNLIITDPSGNILNDFIISFDNNKFVCPEIAYNLARDCYGIGEKLRDDCEIMFDKHLGLEPYNMFLN